MKADNVMRVVRVCGAGLKEHIGKLFVVSSNEAVFDETCQSIASQGSRQDRVISLTPVQIKALSELGDDVLARAIEASGANLAGLVLDAEEGVPSFLMMKVPEAAVAVEADLFAYKLDKLNKEALSAMMENVADNDPAALRSFIERTGLDLAGLPASRGGRRSAAQRAQDIELYRENFLSNLLVIRGAEHHSEDELKQARHQLKVVLSNLSPATLSEFMYDVLLTGMIPEDHIIEERFLNLEAAAKKSPVHLYIDPAATGETVKNSDGKYRLSFSVGENAPVRPLTFPGKVETAIFYTVVLFRKHNDQKLIEILSLEKEFCGVYRALYRTGYAKAKEEYDGIMDLREDGQLISQGRYRNYIPNIRNAVNSALSGIENPAIYHYDYHYRKGGSFFVDRDHISLSEKFIRAANCLQSPTFEIEHLPRGI